MASVNAIARIIAVWIFGAASGLRPMASIAFGSQLPDSERRTDRSDADREPRRDGFGRHIASEEARPPHSLLLLLWLDQLP